MLALTFALLGFSSWSASAAASESGSVLAWGYNADGELGNGGTASSTVPAPVSGGAIPPGTTFTRVAVGFNHSLALSARGQVYAWGRNDHGQLGDGTPNDAHVPVAVSAGAIPRGTRISQIAAGNDVSVALSSTGQLYAWGSNTYGDLGTGPTSDAHVPVAVSAGEMPPGTTFTSVAAGMYHILALSSSGQLYTWGANFSGQLGTGTTHDSSVPKSVTAGAIPVGAKLTEIAAGGNHNLALSASGQLYAWGENVFFGELGNGTTTNQSAPVAVSAGAIPAGAQVTQIAAGDRHSLALDASGQLYAWGRDNHGQLGINSLSNESAPSRVAMYDIPAREAITQIAAGDNYSLALSASGQLYSWGENEAGRLGDGDTTDLSVPETAALPAGMRIASLAQGSVASHRLALTASNGTGGRGGPVLVVNELKIAPRAFAAARRGPSVSAAGVGHPVGARVTYALTIAANVRFTAEQKLPGKVQGSGPSARCAAQTASNRRGRRCTRLVPVRGSFTRAGSGGANRFRFTGRLGGRALKLGSYVLAATPTAAAKTGRPVTVSFQIIHGR
ncbi:MAG: RCC1 domain-containing protein [Solirubrobacteraceae bacterium]